MTEQKYSVERNVQQLVSLMKAHGVRKIVASPGNTNITFVGSVMNDPYFQVYSCIDERSAAYIACGMAEESGEPVALSCTGATAARNYPSGLTEAYYRKLPILAITSSQPFGREGQLFPQYTDRTVQFKDIVTLSVQIPYPYSADEEWANNVKINNALLQLYRNGGSPVHINIATNFSRDFSVSVLPDERVIRRFTTRDQFPELNVGKVCVFVGSHKKFPSELQQSIDDFCDRYNAIVLCDQTSNYKGKYRILGGLAAGQMNYLPLCRNADVIIHLGEITGSYYSFKNAKVWRVNSDGEVRDPFKLLCSIFEMEEEEFFYYYNERKEPVMNTYYQECIDEERNMNVELQELPLSNAWMCQQTASKLPENSVLHLGILNSLRSWNLFDTPRSVYSYSNVGGFGIDGVLSACVGASLAEKDKLCFCVLGDLAMFYDMNVLGNRHIGNNLRIIVSNNGTGYEMHCPGSIGEEFGEDSDLYFAAGGHYGKQSRKLLKDYAENLGFEYISAESKEEYLSYLDYFVSPKMHDKPILIEVFVREEDDDKAYRLTREIRQDVTSRAKDLAKTVLGEKGFQELKKILKK